MRNKEETTRCFAGRQERRYDAVIFDLDGTLLDTLDDLTAAANAAAASCGLSPFTREEICGFVGNGIRTLIRRMLPEEMREQYFDAAYDTFRAYYADHCTELTEPYPGVLRLLERLKAEGYRTAIVSNKADFAVKKLDQFYFPQLTDLAVGEHDGMKKKPDPEMVRFALDTLQTPASRAVYVGDSDVDIETAAGAGMDAILVTWGFREKEFLLERGAKWLAKDARELYRLIHQEA